MQEECLWCLRSPPPPPLSCRRGTCAGGRRTADWARPCRGVSVRLARTAPPPCCRPVFTLCTLDPRKGSGACAGSPPSSTCRTAGRHSITTCCGGTGRRTPSPRWSSSATASGGSRRGERGRRGEPGPQGTWTEGWAGRCQTGSRWEAGCLSANNFSLPLGRAETAFLNGGKQSFLTTNSILGLRHTSCRFSLRRWAVAGAFTPAAKYLTSSTPPF